MPRLKCAGSRVVEYPRAFEGYMLFNIVVPKGNQNDFKINGNPNVLTGNMFNNVPGTNGEWLYCRLDMNDVQACKYPFKKLITIENTSSNFQFSAIESGANKGRNAPDSIYNPWGASIGYFSNYGNLEGAGGSILGKDTIICAGDSILLDGTMSGATAYIWSTGETTPRIHIDSPGTYWVRVKGNVCTHSDTIKVRLVDAHFELNLGPDTTLCLGQSLTLNPGENDTTPALWQWSTGAETSEITINKSGTYWVKATFSPCYISLSDTISVQMKSCDCQVWLPNAFCPNGDGTNDVFRPVILNECPVIDYRFQIYNRWGQLVFYSEQPGEG